METNIDTKTCNNNSIISKSEHTVIEDYRLKVTPNNNIIICCEHATNNLHDLESIATDLDKIILNTHWGYDPGSLDISKKLAKDSNLLLIYPNFSRLILDPNRSLLSNTLIRTNVAFENNHKFELNSLDKNFSNLVENVDSNKELRSTIISSDKSYKIGFNLPKYLNRKDRLSKFYIPYYNSLYDVLESLKPTMFISIHSFTKQYENLPPREYCIGLLFKELNIVVKIIADMLEKNKISYRYNEPYTADISNAFFTMENYNFSKKVNGVCIEVRNDLATDTNFTNKLVMILNDAVNELNKKNH